MLRKIVFSYFFLLFAFAFSEKHSPSPYVFPELKFFPVMPLSSDNPITKEGTDLGRYLFYDPILSLDSTVSCANCHKQEHAFSDSPNEFSTGITGKKMQRNTPPLFNLAWYPALFWDGKAKNIEEQVFHPVAQHDEMNLKWTQAESRIRNSKFYRSKFKAAFGETKIDSILIAKAIAQFERSLISYRSKYDYVLAGKAYFTLDEYKGFVLVNDMTKGDCLHCHTSDANALGTTLTFSNNGLDSIFNTADYKDKGKGAVSGNEKENGKFKIPSFRNVALTAPYMHDGRFKTLQEVLDFYSEGVNASANIDSKMGFAHRKGAHLSCEEKEQIIAFLLTLTDSVFIRDAAFSNPFLTQ